MSEPSEIKTYTQEHLMNSLTVFVDLSWFGNIKLNEIVMPSTSLFHLNENGGATHELQTNNIYTYKRFTVQVLFFLLFFFFVCVCFVFGCPIMCQLQSHFSHAAHPAIPSPSKTNNIYMYKRFTVLVLFLLSNFCFFVCLFLFWAVPTQVLTSEPLFPHCSSQHPYPQQRNIYVSKRFTVSVLFFPFV